MRYGSKESLLTAYKHENEKDNGYLYGQKGHAHQIPIADWGLSSAYGIVCVACLLGM